MTTPDSAGGTPVPPPRRPRRSSGARRSDAAPPTGCTVELGEGAERQSIAVGLVGELVAVDGRELPASIVSIPGSPLHLLRLGDAVHEIAVDRGAHRGAYVLTLGGRRVAVEALDERARAVRSLRAAAAPHGPEQVRAPMPGLVTRVLVAPGDAVKAGDPLIVMEAMKMENELRARGDGRVQSVVARPGTAVEKGAVLVELVRLG